MPHRWVVLAAAALLLVVALPLVLYGSLRPCEILRQDLRTAFRAAAGQMVGPSSADAMDQAARKLGAALATAIADPVIDELVAPIGAVECSRLVVKLKVDPEAALDDPARRRRLLFTMLTALDDRQHTDLDGGRGPSRSTGTAAVPYIVRIAHGDAAAPR